MNFILSLISRIKIEFNAFCFGFKKGFVTSKTARNVLSDAQALRRANQLASNIEIVVKNTLEGNNELASGIGSLAFAHSENQYVVEGFAWREKLNGEIQVATYTMEGTKSAETTIKAPHNGDACKAIARQFKANLISRGFTAFNFRFFANQ